MSANLKNFSFIALLAVCGSISAAPADTQQDDDRAARIAAADGDSMPSEAQSPTDPINTAGNRASAGDPAPELGERRTQTGGRLTLRQKRIFVLGMTAPENQ